jgi:hypothetical protein
VALTLVYTFPVTIPAGTPQATPLATATTFEPNVVERIDWLFPHGCNGHVGIQIGARSNPVLPPVKGQWFLRSGSAGGVDVQDVPVTGDWSVIGYNTGSFDHTIQVAFHVHRTVKEPPMFKLLDNPDLSHWPTFEPVRYG